MHEYDMHALVHGHNTIPNLMIYCEISDLYELLINSRFVTHIPANKLMFSESAPRKLKIDSYRNNECCYFFTTDCKYLHRR